MANSEFKASGYLCLSNSGGIEVEINSCGDGVRYRFTHDQKVSRWQEIKYSRRESRPYFVCHKRRYYLDQFMRY